LSFHKETLGSGRAPRGLSLSMHVPVRLERHSPTDGTPLPRLRALVVDDEAPIRELLRLHLELAGFEVSECGDGRDALERLGSIAFDVVLLDLMLPGIDGVALCRAARNAGPNTAAPILLLSARGAEADKVLGLQSGADDYVTKPFGVMELLARVEAVMRRSARPTPDAPRVDDRRRHVHAADLVLDCERREAQVRGIVIELTRQEFDVLCLLASKRGLVFSRAALLAHAWRRDGRVTGRTVDTVISRLRHKIEPDPGAPRHIVTVWGVGYKFADGD
jgi:DNA-binding response OmpR family regulator